jgi:hypothetical protein
MQNNDIVVLVNVGIPTNPDGGSSVSFWSYGHRAQSFTYRKDGPPLDRFMIMCASTYVTAEHGCWKFELVSGPNLVGPSEYMLVFRPTTAVDQESVAR